MARIRTIKPEFFTSEDIVDLSLFARLLYVALWCEADREGRMVWKPKTFKMRYFPADNLNIEDVASELIDRGLVRLYGDGLAYIPSFLDHQHINPREQQSKLPDPDATVTRESRDSDAQVGREGKGKEGVEANASVACQPAVDLLADIAEQTKSASPMVCPVSEIVELYHECLPDNPRCKVLNDARRRAIQARWREASRLSCRPFGYSTKADGLDAWKLFFEVCAESPFLTGRSQPRPGMPPFIADIDFLMSPSGFAKCLENKFHREAA